MNQIDIYIGDYRLDLFQDEQISIDLAIQNYQDISKVFTDVTQPFTVPASDWNNEVMHNYYRTDITASQITTSYGSSANTFDFRLRQTARIEINSVPFRTGVIQMNNVLIKDNEPNSYSLTFFGDLVNLSDLFGEDYLYDLDLSAYDHTYDATTVQSGFDSDSLNSGDMFYPLMSPQNNWFYNSSASSHNASNIAFHNTHSHGVTWNQLKPCLKVDKILDAIATKYGLTFSGSFLTTSPFTKLFLWLHRYEGYLFNSASAIDWQIVNFNSLNSGSGFDLSTDTWTVASASSYNLDVTVQNASSAYELAIFVNGTQVAMAQSAAHASSSVTSDFVGINLQAGDTVKLYIRPQSPASFNYQVTQYLVQTSKPPQTSIFDADQSLGATYNFQLAVSPLMPEIKVKDFLGGIIQMHNLVVVPTSKTSFAFETLDSWFAAGTDQDIQQYINVDEISVQRPSLYRQIEFAYQDTDQILGFEFQRLNVSGYGDLFSNFSWDGPDFKVQLPFENPLFERLTNLDNSALTNVLVYKSITQNTNTSNEFNPYLGAPVLVYGEFSLDISANPIGFIDDAGNSTQVDRVWYANVSSTSIGTGQAFSLNFGGDIDPFYLVSVGKSLYQTYWSNYILGLYNENRRVYQVKAKLPLGDIINLQLNNKIIWNNQKWIINTASVNMATNEVKFELLNEV
jgi:hypothetical protein